MTPTTDKTPFDMNKNDDFTGRLLEKWLPAGFAALFGAIALASLAGFIITGMRHCLLTAAIGALVAWATATGKGKED